MLDDGRVFALRRRVEGVDIETFEALNTLWARDRSAVYLYEKRLPNADRDSFTVLNEIFAKDCASVYWLGGILTEADANTFQVLDSGKHVSLFGSESFEGYAKDRAGVFHYTLTIGKPRRLRGADLSTFVVVRPPYARDKVSWYYAGNRIKQADPESFRLLGGLYAKDERRVYFADHVLEQAEPKSFEVVDEQKLISRDSYHTFKRDRIKD